MRRWGPGDRRAVVKFPRRTRRYWRNTGKARDRSARRQARGRVSLGVRVGRIAFFGLLGALLAVRLGDLAIGYATPTTGCRVTGVVDGDTVRLSCRDSDDTRGRLLGFDTPEMYSPKCASEYRQGVAATWRLRKELWSASKVETRGGGHDRYGRRLVTLYLDGENVADIMVGAGLARRYTGGTRLGWCE